MKLDEKTKKLLNFSLINIDKPSGPTSFQVSQYIKNALELDKTAHMGTLDPQVTGVLPVTLGRACKLSDYFMHKDKEYVGIMRLHSKVSLTSLRKEAEQFVGKIKQKPPVRSAVKRQERVRQVKYLKLIEKKDKDVIFKTTVEAGTYIRKLVHDIGERVGGAHMLELRRTKASIFNEKTSLTLYQFDKLLKKPEELIKHLIPAEEAIRKVLPGVQISDSHHRELMDGKPILPSYLGEVPKEERFALFSGEKFIGIYHKVKEEGIIARAEFVYN